MSNDIKIPVVVLKNLDDFSLQSKKNLSSSENTDSEDEDVLPRFVHTKVAYQVDEEKKSNRAEALKEFFNDLDEPEESETTKNLEKELSTILNQPKDESTWLQENEGAIKTLEGLIPNKTTENILIMHPGEDVFGQKFIFVLEQLTFKDLPEVKTDFDKFLQSKSFDQVKMLLSGNFLLFQFENVTSKDFVVKRLFQFMSINDLHIAEKCSELLLQIFTVNSNLSQNITIENFMDALINMGLDLNSDDLISTVFGMSYISSFKEKLTQPMVDRSSLSQNYILSDQLEAYLDVLRASFKFAKISRTSLELSAFITSLVYISLDVNLKSSFIFPKVSLCLAEILNRFEADIWMKEKHMLVSKLILLTPSHRNLYFIADLFSHSVRSIQLRRLFSYLVLHKLLKINLPTTQMDDVTPIMVFDLVNLKFLESIKDCHWLEIATKFLDMSVDTDDHSKYLKTFSDLSGLVKKIGSHQYIKETVDNIFTSKIKNCLDRLYLKWLTYAKEAPTSQMTVFKYLTPLENNSPSS